MLIPPSASAARQIVVFTIVTSTNAGRKSVGRRHFAGRPNFPGNLYLSRIAERNRRRALRLSFSLTSFAPYLEDSTRRLNRQYLVSFPCPARKERGMQSAVKVRTEVPHAQLVAAEKIYVPAKQ